MLDNLLFLFSYRSFFGRLCIFYSCHFSQLVVLKVRVVKVLLDLLGRRHLPFFLLGLLCKYGKLGSLELLWLLHGFDILLFYDIFCETRGLYLDFDDYFLLLDYFHHFLGLLNFFFFNDNNCLLDRRLLFFLLCWLLNLDLTLLLFNLLTLHCFLGLLFIFFECCDHTLLIHFVTLLALLIEPFDVARV